MIKKVLILEDNDERIARFKDNLFGLDILVVKEAAQAIIHLTHEKWDVLFLDHDLGGEIHVSTENANTGSEVARWLEKNTDKKPRVIIIHSLNAPGQRHIKHLVPEAVIMPFAWTKITYQNLIEANVPVLEKLASDQCEFIIEKG